MKRILHGIVNKFLHAVLGGEVASIRKKHISESLFAHDKIRNKNLYTRTHNTYIIKVKKNTTHRKEL